MSIFIVKKYCHGAADIMRAALENTVRVLDLPIDLNRFHY